MKTPRVAVLVDLPREAGSGGHVKYWERVARAAVKENAPVDLTVYFSGSGTDEILSPSAGAPSSPDKDAAGIRGDRSCQVRFRFLPPVFSTSRLKFLPYVPAHTDLAPFHPRLARELAAYDVIHTTDAYFAFARTAERVARWRHIPLVTSFHTDTPAYAELFTRQTVQSLLGKKFGGWVDAAFGISARERASMEKRLIRHLRACAAIFAIRPEDRAMTQRAGAADRIRPMRRGVDKDLFAPQPQARGETERDYGIAPGKFIVLFVGRVDAGKNMPVLLQACREVIGKGVKLHLLVAGLGPMSGEVGEKLGENATLAGLLPPEKLARLYAAADCLAVASEIEIGGMVGNEALACGCPVLVSRSSGVAQLCAGTEAMQMVESGVAAWAAALETLARDQAKQAAMREAASAFRREHVASWNDALNDFVPVWQNPARREGE